MSHNLSSCDPPTARKLLVVSLLMTLVEGQLFSFLFFIFFLFHFKPMDLNVAVLSVVTKDVPSSPRFTPYEFLSLCEFDTQLVYQWLDFTYSRSHSFRYGRNNTNYGDKNRTRSTRIELTTSALAGVQVTYDRPLGRRLNSRNCINNSYPKTSS